MKPNDDNERPEKYGKNFKNLQCPLSTHGIKLYKRCDYCKIKFSACTGVRSVLILTLVSISLSLFMVIADPILVKINIMTVLGLLFYLGYILNKNIENLARADFLNGVLNSKLKEKTQNLEEQIRARTTRLEELLKKDWLTGMINRKEFEKRLRHILQDAFDNNNKHVLCFIDLDRFKIVNDTCGHRAGDELLRQITPMIKNHVAESDTVARLGGDEFGVLFSYTTIDEVLPILENIRQEVEDYRFSWEDSMFSIGTSIGVIGINKNSGTVVELLAAVDDACFRAKELGRNRVQVYEYDAADLDKRHGETHWANRIVSALDDDRFVLYYQPIMALEKNKKSKEAVGSLDQCTHYEVLLRMLDSKNFIIPPMAFIPAAERFDLMVKIDHWVIRNAIKSYQELAAVNENLMLSINLSGASLNDETLLDYICGLFAHYEVDPSVFIFEVTETTAIASMQKASEFIKKLKEKGCRFSLDDFGSGLSSFGYLKNLDVDYIKIDGSFVREVASDKTAYTFVEAINRVGHLMHKKIIAEYVESKEVLFALKNIGVDYAQGFAIGKPQSMESLVNRAKKPRLKLVE